ncbi:hypothetical protein [Bacillus thuringiensis]|uniref:hypothetical protein n=1 Tax=Bacillus thuringiensis TaxID=1428 RepID=UPI0021D64A43|nr:hypothetical protein [Bacillus thuringiensis]MCU7667369.1 hypothetical protein [Bacillus thuringiensis]
MTRKRFIKLAMSQGCSKRVAVWASNYCRITYGSYDKAWDELYGCISGRFEGYINMDLKIYENK